MAAPKIAGNEFYERLARSLARREHFAKRKGFESIDTNGKLTENHFSEDF